MSQLMKSGSSIFKVGNNVFRYNSQCLFSTILNPITTVQGTFNNPVAIGIDYPSTTFPNGRMFVANYSNSTVSIINYINPYAGTPTVITSVQGSFSGPQCIAIDLPSAAFPNGRLFVSNGVSNTISVLNYLNPTSGTITTISNSFSNPQMIAIDLPSTSFPNGRIFVANYSSSSVSILNYMTPTTTATVVNTNQGSFNCCQGLAVDSTNNRIFVTNSTLTSGPSGTITILNYLNPTTVTPTLITTTQGSFSQPRNISLDIANNRIFVVNQYNYTVSILNYNNPTVGSPTVITQVQGSINNPTGSAVDTLNNRIFVTNGSGSTISVITNNFT